MWSDSSIFYLRKIDFRGYCRDIDSSVRWQYWWGIELWLYIIMKRGFWVKIYAWNLLIDGLSSLSFEWCCRKVWLLVLELLQAVLEVKMVNFHQFLGFQLVGRWVCGILIWAIYQIKEVIFVVRFIIFLFAENWFSGLL